MPKCMGRTSSAISVFCFLVPSCGHAAFTPHSRGYSGYGLPGEVILMVEHKGNLHLLLQWYEPAFSKNQRRGQLAKWEDIAMVNMPLLKKASTMDFVPASNVEAVCFVGAVPLEFRWIFVVLILPCFCSTAPCTTRASHWWVASTDEHCVFDEVHEEGGAVGAGGSGGQNGSTANSTSSSDSESDENAPCSGDASSDSSSRGSDSRNSSSGDSESDGEDEILGSESGADSN